MKVIVVLIILISSQLNAQTFFNQPTGVKVRIIDSFETLKGLNHGKLVQQVILEDSFLQSPSISYNINLSTESWIQKDISDVVKNLPFLMYASEEARMQVAMMESLVQSLEKAGQEGVKIINYSVTGEINDPEEQKQIERILNKYDMILVTAAGNNGKTTKTYPCAYPSVRIICVGAGYYSESYLRKDNFTIPKGSNRGDHVDFYSHPVTWNGESPVAGTSFSTPRVTASLAMIMSTLPKLKPLEAVDYLKRQGKFIAIGLVAESLEKEINPYTYFLFNLGE